jgi:hypothetical protein
MDNRLTHEIIGAAIEVHRLLGPGLLESAYEECLCRELLLRNFAVERQVPIPEAVMLTYLRLSGYPVGLLINFNVTILKDGIKRFVFDTKQEKNLHREH